MKRFPHIIIEPNSLGIGLSIDLGVGFVQRKYTINLTDYLLPYFIDAQLHELYLLFLRYIYNGSLILIHHLVFIWRSPPWFPRYRVVPVRLVSLSANMLRPLRHSKIKKVFERKVTYVVFTLPDTDRIGLYCYVKNSVQCTDSDADWYCTQFGT